MPKHSGGFNVTTELAPHASVLPVCLSDVSRAVHADEDRFGGLQVKITLICDMFMHRSLASLQSNEFVDHWVIDRGT